MEIQNSYILLFTTLTILIIAYIIVKRKYQSVQKSQSSPANIPQPSEKSQKELQLVCQQKTKQEIRIKNLEDLKNQYGGFFYGNLKVKSPNSIVSITALAFKGSKILLGNSKNQMLMYDLKTWKRDQNSPPQKYFVNLGNNSASAVEIGKKYLYACLNFDKTIVIYEFKGGQNKTYFREVKRFQRNIMKSSANAIHVAQSEQYLITTGSGNDTVVDVWSANGEKLATTNSYQIEHYEISCGNLNILIRGWTSELKVFSVIEEKDGSFKALDKKVHLPNDESPLHAAIDNLDMFAISINKMHKIKFWEIYGTIHKEIVSEELNEKGYSKCALYTFQSGFQRFKPLVILGFDKGFIVADFHLKVIKEVQGVQVKEILVTGTSKRVIVGVLTPQGQVMLFNIEKELELVPDISL